MEDETAADADTCRTALLQLSKRFNVPFSVFLNPMDPALELQVTIHAPVVPIEAQNMILGHLGLEDLRSFRAVSKNWNQLICSNHLKGVHPVVVFSKQKEVKEKGIAKFLALMENNSQIFPFSRFRICLDEGVESVIRFAEEYGSQITHLVLEDNMNKKVEGRTAHLTTMVQSLLSNSPNLESLELNIYEDKLSPQFTLTTPLPRLKKVSVWPGCREGNVIDALAFASENLEEIQITLCPAKRRPDLLMSTMVYKLKKLQHVPKVILTCRPAPEDDVIGFLTLLREVPLHVQELKVILEAEAPDENSVLHQWIESFSPTLKSLTFLKRNDAWPSEEMELPFMENLERLTLGSLNWLEGMKPRLLQFPRLVSLCLQWAEIEDLSFILTEMTYLEELDISFSNSCALKAFLGLGWPKFADSETWLHEPLEDFDDPLPSLVNMTRLRSLILGCTFSFDCCGMEELKMIAFLSLTKTLRRLHFLGVWCLKMNWEDPSVKQICARLRECHDKVEIGAWKDPREYFREEEDGDEV